MQFKSLEIRHVRNLSQVHLELAPGLNYFYGDNGAGKTAVLEAVHLLSRGRSFRTSVARELIERGEAALLVRGEIEDEHRGLVQAGLRRDVQGDTELRVDGQRVQRVSDVARLVPLQTLLPDVGELVFGGPSARRSWLDWGLFHVKHDYLSILRAYQRVLRQRNSLLRQGVRDAAAYAPWDHELAQLAAKVSSERETYLAQLQPHVETNLHSLAPAFGVTLAYRRGWPAGQELEKLLGEKDPGEVKLTATQWGAHRAEVVLRVDGDGEAPAAKVLSRGQGKLLATAMKIAQVAQLQEIARRSSIFLIDDVGAELDAAHTRRFFHLLRDMRCQVLATSALPADERYGFAEDLSVMFHVEHGQVRQE